MVSNREKRARHSGNRGYLYIHMMIRITHSVLFAAMLVWICCSGRERPHFVWAAVITAILTLICTVDVVVFYKKVFKPQLGIQELIRMLESTFGPVVGNNIDQSQILAQLLNRQANYELLRREAEIEALQSQINPHFLYNTLETIRGQAICAGATDIADTTKALANIFRYSISKNGTLIPLSDEISNIQSYMKIQQVRFSYKFELRLEIDEEVEDLKLPKLIIQPVVENALKHGLEEKMEEGYVLIHSFRTPTELIIEVTDNGVGMTTERLKTVNDRIIGKQVADYKEETSTHIGLSNISARIKMIYGDQYGLIVSSAEGIGTTVTLHLGIMK